MLLHWAYFFYLATFLGGLAFFFLFDLRKKALPHAVLGVHITMTVVTFILFTSALSGYVRVPARQAAPVGRQSAIWNAVQLHRELIKRYHSPLAGGG